MQHYSPLRLLLTALRRSKCSSPPAGRHRGPVNLPETMQARHAGSGVRQADPPQAQSAPTAHAIACGLARARTARAGTEEPMRKRQRTQWSDRAWHHNPSCLCDPILLAELDSRELPGCRRLLAASC